MKGFFEKISGKGQRKQADAAIDAAMGKPKKPAAPKPTAKKPQAKRGG